MKVLHAGCGLAPLPAWFNEWEQVRLDADKEVEPDIVANIDDIGDIGKFDAIYCSHTLEHLYPHQVKEALKGFLGALNDNGFVLCRLCFSRKQGITIHSGINHGGGF